MLSRTGLRATRFARNPACARQAARRGVTNSGHTEPKLEGVYDNAFNRERLAVKQHAAATADFWRKLSIYVVIPCLIVTGVNTWIQWNAHWEHQAHEPPIEDRPQYAYMNIRTKSFPWGDGNKSLFWNDKYNYYKKD